LSFDLTAAERRIRPQRETSPLRRRPSGSLSFVSGPALAGPPLMLDTCVYIDVLQGRTPSEVDELLSMRLLNHSSVCLAELTHLFGRLEPRHEQTRVTLQRIVAAIGDIPGRRLASPGVRAFGEAGMLAGLAMRLTGRSSEERMELLNDAVLYLHALERGCTLLTRNVRDFDFFNQLVPAGQVLFYRTPARNGAS
jgi:predicted nucleic acid-binding protein